MFCPSNQSLDVERAVDCLQQDTIRRSSLVNTRGFLNHADQDYVWYLHTDSCLLMIWSVCKEETKQTITTDLVFRCEIHPTLVRRLVDASFGTKIGVRLEFKTGNETPAILGNPSNDGLPVYQDHLQSVTLVTPVFLLKLTPKGEELRILPTVESLSHLRTSVYLWCPHSQGHIPLHGLVRPSFGPHQTKFTKTKTTSAPVDTVDTNVIQWDVKTRFFLNDVPYFVPVRSGNAITKLYWNKSDDIVDFVQLSDTKIFVGTTTTSKKFNYQTYTSLSKTRQYEKQGKKGQLKDFGREWWIVVINHTPYVAHVEMTHKKTGCPFSLHFKLIKIPKATTLSPSSMNLFPVRQEATSPETNNYQVKLTSMQLTITHKDRSSEQTWSYLDQSVTQPPVDHQSYNGDPLAWCEDSRSISGLLSRMLKETTSIGDHELGLEIKDNDENDGYTFIVKTRLRTYTFTTREDNQLDVVPYQRKTTCRVQDDVKKDDTTRIEMIMKQLWSFWQRQITLPTTDERRTKAQVISKTTTTHQAAQVFSFTVDTVTEEDFINSFLDQKFKGFYDVGKRQQAKKTIQAVIDDNKQTRVIIQKNLKNLREILQHTAIKVNPTVDWRKINGLKHKIKDLPFTGMIDYLRDYTLDFVYQVINAAIAQAKLPETQSPEAKSPEAESLEAKLFEQVMLDLQKQFGLSNNPDFKLDKTDMYPLVQRIVEDMKGMETIINDQQKQLMVAFQKQQDGEMITVASALAPSCQSLLQQWVYFFMLDETLNCVSLPTIINE